MIQKEETEHVLSKRLCKVLETLFQDDQGTLEALRQLSTFYTENNIQARRDLRSKIEKRNLDINLALVLSFLNVKDSFMIIYENIADMSLCVNEITCRLQNSKQRTNSLLQQTNMLQSKRNRIILHRELSVAFQNQFQLSSEETVTLYRNKKSSSLPHSIFSILDKIGYIHRNSKLLIRSGLQSLASDAMEQMIFHQEDALERVYRWTQNNCRYVDNKEFTELIAVAMSKIQDRPPLFRYVTDEYCSCRRGMLVSAFINALTKGGPSGKPAPIEMKAHDVQIYVTDMFVWINKAILIEQQNLLVLVKLCNNIDNEFILGALIRICDGLCQPLKLRIEKVFNVPNQVTVLYSVVNLLRYYSKCICKVVPRGSLAETLFYLQNLCEEVFVNTLHKEVNDALIKVQIPLRDLCPTPVINNLLGLLRDLLCTANMSEGRENDMKKITTYIIEPLLRFVNEQASRLPPLEMSIYMLNCINDMYLCLSLFEYMDIFLERLQAQSDAQIDNLTSEQSSFLVAHLNIGPLYTILQDLQKEPLSTISGLEPFNMRNFFVKLESLIVSTEIILLPLCNQLASSKYKEIIEKRSREVLLAIYTQLYEAVNKADNEYEDPHLLFNKTPDELKAALS